MSQNMIALKRQLMQSKLSVLMPSIKFVNKCIQTYNFSRKISQVGGPQGGAEISLGGGPSWSPLRTAPA